MTAAVSNTRLRQHMPGLLSLALASAVAVTTEMLPVGLLPSIGRTFSVADSVTGLLVSLYAVLVAALAVPLTAGTTRFSRKRLLMTTLLCYAVGNALVAAAPTFAVVSVGRAIGGVTDAMFFSLCVGYTPRLVAAQQVGRALAQTMGGTSAGFILGVPILTALGTACGWRAAFGTLALLTVLTLLLIARLLPAVGNEIPSRDAGTGHGRSVLAAVAVSNATTTWASSPCTRSSAWCCWRPEFARRSWARCCSRVACVDLSASGTPAAHWTVTRGRPSW